MNSSWLMKIYSNDLTEGRILEWQDTRHLNDKTGIGMSSIVIFSIVHFFPSYLVPSQWEGEDPKSRGVHQSLGMKRNSIASSIKVDHIHRKDLSWRSGQRSRRPRFGHLFEGYWEMLWQQPKINAALWPIAIQVLSLISALKWMLYSFNATSRPWTWSV